MKNCRRIGSVARRPLPWVLGLGLALATSGLMGARGGTGSAEAPFAVTGISLVGEPTWHLNAPVEIAFNQPVDFSTVNQNTVRVRSVAGVPAAGHYLQKGPRTVVFQPRCPSLEDLSDAGLSAGGIVYRLVVVGIDTSPNTVKSAGGQPLAVTEVRHWKTPRSLAPAEVFIDLVPGPPTPVIRLQGSGDPRATYWEIGGDPDQRIYFERDPASGAVALEGGQSLPLNLYSDPATQAVLVLQLDQSILPFAGNLSPERLYLEYDEHGTARLLPAALELEANCSPAGATVRLDPQGVLPPGTNVRAVISDELADLVGETHPAALTRFASAPTMDAPARLADEILEEFLLGAGTPGSLQAPLAPHELPATWANGKLVAETGFAGTGGPGGDFDWQVPNGITFIFDTTSQVIVGGPNFVPTSQSVVINGVIDVRRMRVGHGAVLKFIGPNPVTVLASGEVEILGRIVLDGVHNPGVATLNTTNIPEPGALGQAGGGRGGTGSPETTTSSSGGAPGFGAFDGAGGGGAGGETGWHHLTSSTNSRRGGGGGGGSFGQDQLRDYGPPVNFAVDETWIGLNVEPGFHGSTSAFGAWDPAAHAHPPQGGQPGARPFQDPDPANDFFGAHLDPHTGESIRGELARPWAGAGGGGGGDASFTNGQVFPMVPFHPTGDEKGAGGGGGAGSLWLRTLDDVVFGPDGQISACGGNGGGGENTNFLDRVGGGSGGGSGGHVILECLGSIDFSQLVSVPPAPHQALLATGGQGGAGKDNQGGATPGPGGSKQTAPLHDACPDPSLGCKGHVDAAGGDGGPGIIQLHTPGGMGIVLPPGQILHEICKPAPFLSTVPSFGPVSIARSVWIPLGAGGLDASNPAQAYEPVEFRFEGTDPVTGAVQTIGSAVAVLPPILGPASLGIPPALPAVAGPYTLVMNASPLVGTPSEILLANPNLLRGFVLDLEPPGAPSGARRFEVVDAAFDGAAAPATLSLFLSTAGPALPAAPPPGGLDVLLRPAFFRVETEGAADLLSPEDRVVMLFEVTVADASGKPDESQASGFLADPSLFSQLPHNPELRFVRFEVRLEIGTQGAGQPLFTDPPRPALRFLRLPFQY